MSIADWVEHRVKRARLLAAAALIVVAPAAGLAETPKIPPVASLTEGTWLKGDLHLHSRHSTDSSNNSEATIIGFAERAGFDFLGITDHDNHVDGDVAHHTWSDPEFRSDKVVLLYGAEWTTNRGHGNTFSAKPYDHKRLYDIRDARDADIMAMKRELGIHLSANHPSGKDHFGFSFDMVDSIEVWNSVLWSKNAESLMIWDDMLRSGRKLTGRGGSDSHHGNPPSPEKATKNSREATANYVGTPTTWVFARTKTREGVVEALTNGRVSISANPNDPRVELYADRDGDGRADMMMGDNATAAGKPMRFELRLVGGNGAADASFKVRVVRNGETFGEYEARGTNPVLTFEDTPPAGERTYYRVEVRGSHGAYPELPNAVAVAGDMVALSNPLFFNFDPNF